MKYIRKISLAKNESEAEIVAMFNSAFTRKFDAMGVDTMEALIKVCAETPKKPEAEEITKTTLSHKVNVGYNFDNIQYKPFMAGASDARKATTCWFDQSIVAQCGRWAMCGLKTSTMKLAINKYMAYIGLLTSASKPFVEVFGKEINIDRVAVIKDVEVVVDAMCDYVDPTKGVEHDKLRNIVINAFDGLALIRAEMTNGESCTLRGPWLKALALAIKWSWLVGYAISHNLPLKFVDFWGNEVALKDVDIILTESCFKTIKLYESWEQYKSAFKEFNHEICVCVREHKPRLKGLPYQQGQTLLGDTIDAMQFALHSKRTIEKYTTKTGAPGLLRKYHKVASKMYPALLTEAFTKRTLQEMYTTKRNDMLGGRIPELGYNAFLAPDPIAFIQHLFGQPITGYLKPGECYCKNCKPGKVDVTRNPHLDNAHCVLTNVENLPVAESNTMYINIFDATTIKLRADYDGDHVWYSQDEHLLEIIDKTYKQLNNLPVDWDVGSAPKVPINYSNIAQFVINLIHGSEIGLYADALTKMWNTGYDRDVCAWLTYAANVLIDSAKHASVKIKTPDAVKKLGQVSLPLFAMYAKADVDRPVNSDYWLKERVTNSGNVLPPRCAYSGSFLDQYSMMIKEDLPETIEISGLENEVFDVTAMMFDPQRKMENLAGLSKKGSYDPNTGKYVDAGVFQEIAFRHSTEWAKIVGDMNLYEHRQEWEQETAISGLKEIVEWARSKNNGWTDKTDDEVAEICYDIIVRNIHNVKMSEGMDTVVKQAFWRIFGHLAVKALKQNLHVDEVDPEDMDDDDLFDVDIDE